MKNWILIGLIILCNLGCTKNISEKYIFHSNPAFFSGFTLIMDNETKILEIDIPADYFISDSISKTYFKILDSSEMAKIKKFVPQNNKFKFHIDDEKFEMLETKLETLINVELTPEEMRPPNDGITITVEKNYNHKKIHKTFFTPSRASKQGLTINAIYDILETLDFKNGSIEDAVENSKRYYVEEIMKVKSLSPLYVKILTEDCEELENEIIKLPKTQKIYLDVTNMRGFRENCIESIFRKKYSKICLIGKGDYFEN